jgi:hypothetical protein
MIVIIVAHVDLLGASSFHRPLTFIPPVHSDGTLAKKLSHNNEAFGLFPWHMENSPHDWRRFFGFCKARLSGGIPSWVSPRLSNTAESKKNANHCFLRRFCRMMSSVETILTTPGTTATVSFTSFIVSTAMEAPLIPLSRNKSPKTFFIPMIPHRQQTTAIRKSCLIFDSNLSGIFPIPLDVKEGSMAFSALSPTEQQRGIEKDPQIPQSTPIDSLEQK